MVVGIGGGSPFGVPGYQTITHDSYHEFCFASSFPDSFSPYRRKSQIQTFLEQNEGPGLQHLALKTDDIFKTVALMRQAEEELGALN